MDLQGYIRVIWRKKWVVILTVVVTLVIVAVGSLITTRIYSANAVIRIATASSGSISYTDYIYADRLVNTYVKIANSRLVLDDLIKRLNLSEVPVVRVEIVPNTELINIIVEDPNPATAQAAANTLAEILIEQSKSLYSGGGKDPKLILAEQLTQLEQELNEERGAYDELIRNSPSDTEAIAGSLQSLNLKEQTYSTLLAQYEDTRLRDAIRANTISLVETAQLPTKAIRPNLLINFGLGLILSAMAGLGLAFIFDRFDETLHSSEEIEQFIGQPALVKIPSTDPDKTFLPLDGYSPYGEAYRRLRASFLYNVQTLNHRVVMITSPEPEDGKSTIISNLAITLVQAGKKVVLVDGDINVSRIHQLFNLPNQVGLSNVLSGQAIIMDALQTTPFEGLKVLTSGPMLNGYDFLSQRSKIHGLISDLSSFGDIVLINSPAILSVADVADLATEVDSVIMVVRRNLTRQKTLNEAQKQLEELNVTTMGYIINRSEQADYGYKYYQSRKEAAARGIPRDMEK